MLLGAATATGLGAAAEAAKQRGMAKGVALWEFKGEPGPYASPGSMPKDDL
jgi:hypothetical protein